LTKLVSTACCLFRFWRRSAYNSTNLRCLYVEQYVREVGVQRQHGGSRGQRQPEDSNGQQTSARKVVAVSLQINNLSCRSCVRAFTVLCCHLAVVMVVITAAVTLALSGYAAAQLEGRGFPNCQSGPLSDNDVCNTSLGKSRKRRIKLTPNADSLQILWSELLL